MSLRPRYAYLDDDGTIHTVSQARYARVMDPHQREPIPELTGSGAPQKYLPIAFGPPRTPHAPGTAGCPPAERRTRS